MLEGIETHKDIPKEFLKWFYQRFSDADKIDITAEYDRKISIGENEEIFKNKFRHNYTPTKKEELEKAKRTQEEISSQIEESRKREEKMLREEAQKVVVEHKKRAENTQELTGPSFDIMKAKIRTIIKGAGHACHIQGMYGTGKSILTTQLLEVMKQKYEEIDYIPPFELVRKMWSIRNENKILVFHEAETLWKNELTSKILRRMIEDQTIIWQTDEKLMQDIIVPFKTPNIRFIFLSNQELKDKALESRMLTTNFNPSTQELFLLMEQVVEKPKHDSKGNKLKLEERKEVLEYLRKETTEATTNLTLRLLEKGYQYITAKEDWKTLLKDEIREDYLKKVVLEISKKGLRQEQEILEWKELTGMSKTKYYETRKEMAIKKASKI